MRGGRAVVVLRESHLHANLPDGDVGLSNFECDSA